LPKLVSGHHVAAIAMTEPGTGSDLQNVQTHAEKDGNHYKINGSKIFITNGHTADLVVVVAKTDRNAGAKGVSLIVLETEDAEGFRRGRNLKKLGMKGSDTAELFFEDVRVPTANLLGSEEGQGFYQLMKQLPWERLMIGVTALGFIDFAIDETVKYVQDRKAFGSRIMDFQNTRFKLAECKTKAELLRSFVNDGIARLEAGELDAATASQHLLVNGHRAQPGAGPQHRHDFRVEYVFQRIGTPPLSARRLLRREPGILHDPIGGCPAHSRLRGGGLDGVVLSQLHEKPRLMIGYMATRHKGGSPVLKTTSVAG
jgi:alkylation response protein AidB-like acyl-CoA dehydrogenase